MKRSLWIPLLVIGTLSAPLLAGGEAPAGAGGGAPAPATETPTAAAAPPGSSAPTLREEPLGEAGIPAAAMGAAGLTVYKDPSTGRLMPIPPAELRELLTEEVRRAASMSHEGLVETAAPGGGIMIDLQGRFQNVMWATAGPDGAVTADCDQGHLAADPPGPPQDRKE